MTAMPPPELVEQWGEDWYRSKVKHTDLQSYIVAKAVQWGADQELEACFNCINEWGDIHNSFGGELADDLRADRRPKPPSLKKQALVALHAVAAGANDMREQCQDFETIRLALEQLDD